MRYYPVVAEVGGRGLGLSLDRSFPLILVSIVLCLTAKILAVRQVMLNVYLVSFFNEIMFLLKTNNHYRFWKMPGNRSDCYCDWFQVKRLNVYRAGDTHPDSVGGGRVLVCQFGSLGGVPTCVADTPAVSLMVKLPTGSLPSGSKPDAISSI